MDRWAIRYGYDTDQIEYDTFLYLISELDCEFMEHQLEEHKKREASSGNAGGVSKARQKAPR